MYTSNVCIICLSIKKEKQHIDVLINIVIRILDLTVTICVYYARVT